MNISVIIVDDEPLARQIIREYLQPHTDVEILDDFGDPQQAFLAITKKKPDLLFLDIQMPEMTGIELLMQLPDKPAVVFCTAYDQFAIKAFEENAIDYLLKPFDQQRFDKALQKARQLLAGQTTLPALDKLLDHLHPTAPLNRLIVRKGDHLQMVSVDSILWVEALEDYVQLHTNDGKHLLLQRMGDLEKKLPTDRFLRIHRSTIVNLDAIKEIHPWSSGRFLLRLGNGAEIETSKSGAKLIREMMP